LVCALLSFRGASVQSELDAFLDCLGVSAVDLVSDRALAKAHSKLHVPALWALNERLIAYFGECDRSFRRIVTDGLRGDFSAVSVT
jgi:hypothetical protein